MDKTHFLPFFTDQASKATQALQENDLQKCRECLNKMGLLITHNPIYILEQVLEEKTEQDLIKLAEKIQKIDSKTLDQLTDYLLCGLIYAYLCKMQKKNSAFEAAEHFISLGYAQATSLFEKEVFTCLKGLNAFHRGCAVDDRVYFRKAISEYEKIKDTHLYPPQFYINKICPLLALCKKTRKSDLIHHALLILKKSKELNPNVFQTHLYLAICYQNLYKLELKELYLDIANKTYLNIEKDPCFSPQIYKKWAELFILASAVTSKEQFLFEAIEIYKKGLKKEVGDQNLIDGHISAVCKLCIVKDEIEHLNFILHQEPLSFFAKGNIALAKGFYFKELKYFKEAKMWIQKTLDTQSKESDTWYALGLVYFGYSLFEHKINFYEKAIYCFEKAYRLNPFAIHIKMDLAVTYFYLAQVTQEIDKCKNAIFLFEEVALNEKKTSFNHHWLYYYGCSLSLYGDLSQDETHYLRAILVLCQIVEMHPDMIDAKFQLGTCCQLFGEVTRNAHYLKRALHYFNAVIEANNEYAIAYVEAAVCMINLSEVQPSISKAVFLVAAEDYLKKAIMLGDEQSYYYLACICSLLDKIEASIEFLKKAQMTQTLPIIEDLYHDDWLANTRKSKLFTDFVAGLEQGINI
jgi:tetratricopeptide (TPR) repeat protein